VLDGGVFAKQYVGRVHGWHRDRGRQQPRERGFAGFRPDQDAVIAHLIAGRSAAVVFPTGAGKSLCYQLPALMLPGLTVVVSPLIARMKDQFDRLLAAAPRNSCRAAPRRSMNESGNRRPRFASSRLTHSRTRARLLDSSAVSLRRD
jgi:superfamily II DNA or RNA helicase